LVWAGADDRGGDEWECVDVMRDGPPDRGAAEAGTAPTTSTTMPTPAAATRVGHRLGLPGPSRIVST
jgi:hypothetical protein